MPPVRRLAAILAADVAGYSRLMGADEEGTHERLKEHLRELVEPKIAEHRGRIVKNTGDGLLAEFVSVVDAVRCAVEIQRGMAEREHEVPEEQRIRFRIGINLGDVIVEEHDIFGDGVNIAARLEGLAAPGGVCVSGTVLDHIGDRLPYAFADMGEQSVKNIARPVRVYALRSEAVRDRPKSAFKEHLRELVEPKIAEHRGRIVKNTGDGLLAEFVSVVDAVRCAVEIQRGMAEREHEVPEEQRIRFRIGINLGDVIVEEHDIFGDGVNIAARLEGLAAPGGVCVSGTVLDHIGDRLPYAFADMGEQSVKNIARPVRVYALRSEAVRDRPKSAVLDSLPISQPTAAPRLSIVVLPFANLSNDPEQQYFADGITEDLTTDLSRLAGMLVISHNTAITYRNRSVDTKQIGRELGVRYVLEGSVRRSGTRVRVNAQLIDAESDAYLCVDRFDGDEPDLFALQDEVTSRIANTLGVELIAREAARQTQDRDALDFILRGRAELLRPKGRESYDAAIGLFQRALAFDPGSVEAQSRLAMVLANRLMIFGSDAADSDNQEVEALTLRALGMAPRDPLTHFARGLALRMQRRFEEAISEYQATLALNPNMVHALANLGRCKIFIGPIDEAIPPQQQAIRLSPRDPSIGFWYYGIGQAHLLQSRLDEAIVWFEKARSVEPGIPFIRANLAAAYALVDDAEKAAAELGEAQRLDGKGTFSSRARLKLINHGRGVRPEIYELFEATYFTGLRKAGMPESEAVPALPP